MKYFKLKEFDSKDVPGSGEHMDEDFLSKIDMLREKFGHPLKINSGFRTKHQNMLDGGGERSAHLLGRASDISCRVGMLGVAWTHEQKQRFLDLAWECGFKGFGVAKTFFHLDDMTQPEGYLRSSVWDYKTGHAGHATPISSSPKLGEDGWPL